MLNRRPESWAKLELTKRVNEAREDCVRVELWNKQSDVSTNGDARATKKVCNQSEGIPKLRKHGRLIELKSTHTKNQSGISAVLKNKRRGFKCVETIPKQNYFTITIKLIRLISKNKKVKWKKEKRKKRQEQRTEARKNDTGQKRLWNKETGSESRGVWIRKSSKESKKIKLK